MSYLQSCSLCYIQEQEGDQQQSFIGIKVNYIMQMLPSNGSVRRDTKSPELLPKRKRLYVCDKVITPAFFVFEKQNRYIPWKRPE